MPAEFHRQDVRDKVVVAENVRRLEKHLTAHFLGLLILREHHIGAVAVFLRRREARLVREALEAHKPPRVVLLALENVPRAVVALPADIYRIAERVRRIRPLTACNCPERGRDEDFPALVLARIHFEREKPVGKLDAPPDIALKGDFLAYVEQVCEGFRDGDGLAPRLRGGYRDGKTALFLRKRPALGFDKGQQDRFRVSAHLPLAVRIEVPDDSLLEQYPQVVPRDRDDDAPVLRKRLFPRRDYPRRFPADSHDAPARQKIRVRYVVPCLYRELPHVESAPLIGHAFRGIEYPHAQKLSRIPVVVIYDDVPVLNHFKLPKTTRPILSQSESAARSLSAWKSCSRRFQARSSCRCRR